MKSEVTIYQIAEECGVSPATVSRVLNHSTRVSERTRSKVNQAIERHHFSPSSIARAMTNRTTRTIGVILPDITNPYFSALFLEVQRYALEHGYSVLLCNTLYGGASHEIISPFEEMQYFYMLGDRRVDGCIVIGGQLDLDEPSEKYVRALNRLNAAVPVVAIGQPLAGCECTFISRDLGGGVSSLVEHLYTLGNRSIGFIGGQAGIRQTTERLKVYRMTLKALGLEVSENRILLSNYYSPDGYKDMKHFLEQGLQADAMVAINDQVAIGAIRAIFDAGLSVPEDIAVVSCDSFPGSEYQYPRLTGLNQQNDYIGRLAILSLLSAIGGIRETVTVKQAPELIIRESCGKQRCGIRE